MAFPNAFEKHGMGRFMPSGVTSWTPASLGSNLKGWWKADAGVRARTAALFASANSESLSHTGTAALRGQSGTGGWYRAGWVLLTNTGTRRVIQSCLSGNDGYLIEITAGNVLKVTAGTGAALVTATHGTALSAATWYFFVAKYDGVNLSIGLNGGAYVDAALTTYSPGSAAWYLGATVVPDNFHNGALQEVLGDNGDLSGANLAILYAGGSGILSTGTALGAWWFPLHENSGTRTDVRAGALTLTDNNTVTATDGKVDYAAADGDAVWKWEDQSGNSKHFLQTTQAKKPLFKTGIQNSRACLLGDGVDDIMAVGSVVSAATTFSCAAAMQVVVREADPTMLMNGTVGATGWALDTHASLRSITSQGVGFNAGSTDTNTFEIWVVTRNLTGPAWVLRVDGAADALTPSNAAMNAPATNTTIFGTPSETRIVNAYGGEFLIVDALLTAGEIAQLESYLNTRWASF